MFGMFLYFSFFILYFYLFIYLNDHIEGNILIKKTNKQKKHSSLAVAACHLHTTQEVCA